MNEKIAKVIQELKKDIKVRKFTQTYDLIITLKEIDAKKPENRFDVSFQLPKGRGKKANVVIFSDTNSSNNAKVLQTNDINNLGKNKRTAKKFINSSDFLFAEAKLMPIIARTLGTMLGPRGKIPKLLSEDYESQILSSQNSTRIKMKQDPMIQSIVGNDKMSEEDISENIESLLKFVETKLPGGKSNINKVFLKMTMTKPIRLEVF